MKNLLGMALLALSALAVSVPFGSAPAAAPGDPQPVWVEAGNKCTRNGQGECACFIVITHGVCEVPSGGGGGQCRQNVNGTITYTCP